MLEVAQPSFIYTSAVHALLCMASLFANTKQAFVEENVKVHNDGEFQHCLVCDFHHGSCAMLKVLFVPMTSAVVFDEKVESSRSGIDTVGKLVHL